MARRLVSPRLADMVEAMERISIILNGVPLDAFEGNWEKRWLVERGIEVISEASRHLPNDLKARHPNIPWRKVANIGNVLRHVYDRIAPDVLWALARNELIELEAACRAELTSALRDEADGQSE